VLVVVGLSILGYTTSTPLLLNITTSSTTHCRNFLLPPPFSFSQHHHHHQVFDGARAFQIKLPRAKLVWGAVKN